jgi:hypothetical protein
VWNKSDQGESLTCRSIAGIAPPRRAASSALRQAPDHSAGKLKKHEAVIDYSAKPSANEEGGPKVLRRSKQ